MKKVAQKFGGARSLNKDGGSEAVQIVEQLLRKAIRLRASNIHIEPRATNTVVKYRLDGTLRETTPFSKHLMSDIVAYVKHLAALDMSAHKMQDGTFTFTSGHTVYVIRVSIAPVLDGERLVMTIVPEAPDAPTLQALGYWGKNEQFILDALAKQHGIVLIAAPHHAEKATTLHSCIRLLTHPSVNIISIENPVNFRIAGVQQLELDYEAGLGLATGVRLALRQDPNVIIASDIHEQTGLNECVHAAAKHLICAGISANDAIAAYIRLIHMSSDRLGVSTEISVVAAQKTVRRLCESCKQPFTPDAVTYAKLKQLANAYGFMIQSVKELAHTYQQGLSPNVLEHQPNKATPVFWIANHTGCSECHQTGYRGQLGVTEALPNTPDLQALAISSPSPQAIRKLATANGMIPMQIDALAKSIAGFIDCREAFDL